MVAPEGLSLIFLLRILSCILLASPMNFVVAGDNIERVFVVMQGHYGRVEAVPGVRGAPEPCPQPDIGKSHRPGA